MRARARTPTHTHTRSAARSEISAQRNICKEKKTNYLHTRVSTNIREIWQKVRKISGVHDRISHFYSIYWHISTHLQLLSFCSSWIQYTRQHFLFVCYKQPVSPFCLTLIRLNACNKQESFTALYVQYINDVFRYVYNIFRKFFFGCAVFMLYSSWMKKRLCYHFLVNLKLTSRVITYYLLGIIWNATSKTTEAQKFSTREITSLKLWKVKAKSAGSNLHLLRKKKKSQHFGSCIRQFVRFCQILPQMKLKQRGKMITDYFAKEETWSM